MSMKTAAALFVLSAGIAVAGGGWTVEGFAMPESVLHDEVRDRLIVSNIEGAPNGVDGDGYLSLLAMDGTVIDRVWASGMDAPKGMALVGDRLLVADLTKLHVLDAASGEVLETLTHEDAVFLNDVTVDGDVAYISDFMGHAIWRYADGRLAPMIEDAGLSHPNGVLWDDGRLIVGSWGEGMRADFTTETPGDLIALDVESGETQVLVAGLGNLDGIVRVGEALIVSDWVSGALHRVSEDGGVEMIGARPAGLADIGAAGDVVYLPHMLEGRVEALAVE